MTDDEIGKLFQVLFEKNEESNEFYNKKPLLAHYTSLSSLEVILRNDEVWFSNPLYVNDFEEVRFGVNEGHRLFSGNPDIEAAVGTQERYNVLSSSFEQYYSKFANLHVIDTYVFSFSEHDKENNDGLLSMWRGYGSNGDGACFVIDTDKIPVTDDSPLIFAKVYYASTEERVQWLSDCLSKFCGIFRETAIPTDKLYIASHYLFERLKLFALFTKHHGFKEEKEWRVVYLPDRDEQNILAPMIDYWIGPRGIEPKLKFKVKHIPGVTAEGLSLSTIIDRIILGPTTSSALAKASTEKMFDKLNKPELKAKLRTSPIPFRKMG